MKILGIESSADETSAAVVKDGKVLLSNVVATSLDLYTAFGGIVPEIAARSHIESIIPVIDQALTDAFGADSRQKSVDSSKKSQSTVYSLPSTHQFDPWNQIDAIAVTRGPGLGGSLLIGVLTARTLAIAQNKPLYGVNHVEAHVYANFLTQTALTDYKLRTEQPQFPLLSLIVSGGHSQLVLFKNHFNYKVLSQTSDDAVGEAFDKVAKMLGLPYPGGPSVERLAKEGNPQAFKFPRAKMPIPYEFSFSGPKTAVLRAAQEAAGKDFTFPSAKLPEALSDAQKADIAASFQQTAVSTLVDALKLAVQEFEPKTVVIAGGVAASPELRRQIDEQLDQKVEYTDMKLCTDNAAMIATLGYYKVVNKQPPSDPYSLEIDTNLQM